MDYVRIYMKSWCRNLNDSSYTYVLFCKQQHSMQLTNSLMWHGLQICFFLFRQWTIFVLHKHVTYNTLVTLPPCWTSAAIFLDRHVYSSRRKQYWSVKLCTPSHFNSVYLKKKRKLALWAKRWCYQMFWFVVCQHRAGYWENTSI